MTKKVAYICNHCRQEIDGEPNGYGLHFSGNSSAMVVAMREAENHLCSDCARGYYNALKDVF